MSRRRGSPLRLVNNNRTSVWVSPRAKNFDLNRLLKALEEINFPLRYTRGISSINFSILGNPRLFGYYDDGEIYIDVRKKHRLKTIIETIVHEIAHHLDTDAELSDGLSQERRRRGRYIHRIARDSNDEYFARGFERYYSLDPRDRQDLKRFNPRLYARIHKLHRLYRRKRRAVSS